MEEWFNFYYFVVFVDFFVCACCVLGCVTFVVTQSYVKMGKVFLTESAGLS